VGSPRQRLEAGSSGGAAAMQKLQLCGPLQRLARGGLTTPLGVA
jgi:hypothetical protein